MDKDTKSDDSLELSFSDDNSVTVKWRQLLHMSCSVLQSTRSFDKDYVDQKKEKSKYTAGALKTPIYQLKNEDLEILRKYVNVYTSRFRFLRDKEDIYQDLVGELLRTNYLSRFDPSQNSKSGYISRFVYNFCCKKYKLNTYKVNQASSLEDDPTEVHVSTPKSIDFNSIQPLEAMASILDEELPPTSGIKYDTVTGESKGVAYFGELAEEGEFIVWRSSANIFRLLAMNFFQEEIAQVLDVSKGWISKKVKRIRDVSEIKDWADNFVSET